MRESRVCTPPIAYRPDIDGLRAFAVIFVIFYHAFPNIFRAGFIGVDIFFVISGYLIGWIIMSDLEQEKFSFWNFYARRVRRIFPSLITVLTIALLLGWYTLFPHEMQALGKNVSGGAFFVNNFVLWQEAGYFDVSSIFKPLLHLWSLGIEEQFYIFFPVILYITAKNNIKFCFIIFLFLNISFLENIYVYDISKVMDFYSPLTRFWEILSGSFLASFMRKYKTRKLYLLIDRYVYKFIYEKNVDNNGKSLSLLFAIFGFIALFISLLLSRSSNPWPAWNAILPVLGASSFIMSGPHNSISKFLLCNKFSVFIGKISYPLYLWHWVFISYAYICNGNSVNGYKWNLIMICIIIISFIFASITYFYIEMPLRRRAISKATTSILLILLICIGVFGIIIYANDGFPQRYDKNMLNILHNLKGDPLDGRIIYKNEGGYIACVDENSDKTIAIVGDSHAGCAFNSIAKFNKIHRINTILMSDDYFSRDAIGKEGLRKELLEMIANDKKISCVFILYRGVMYLTGKDIDQPKWDGKALYDRLRFFYQEAIDIFVNSGKTVYFVTENPVFRENPQDYVLRPFSFKKLFNINNIYPTMNQSDVAHHQNGYLNIVKSLKNVNIIFSLDTFCPNSKCKMFTDQGIPLYRDGNHLSAEGNRFLVDNLLSPYINKIAEYEKKSSW